MLTLAYKESGCGTYNADIKEDDEVVAIGKWSPSGNGRHWAMVAIGMKGLDGFRSEMGLSLAGPRHFGFDIENVPIGELMASR